MGSGKIKIVNGVEILYPRMSELQSDNMGLQSCYHKTPQNLLKFRAVNERLITARLQGKHDRITVVQCYPPTYDYSENEKYLFYSSLKTMVEQVSTNEVLVVMYDLNAKIVNENVVLERAMVKHRCRKMNKNGERLVDICFDCELVIGRTLFLAQGYPQVNLEVSRWKNSKSNRPSND